MLYAIYLYCFTVEQILMLFMLVNLVIYKTLHYKHLFETYLKFDTGKTLAVVHLICLIYALG